MLEEKFGRVGVAEDRNGCEVSDRECSVFCDGDKLFGVIQIPLGGMSALLRVGSLLLVERAFGRMLGGVVRDCDAFSTALHARQEQHYAKNRDGTQEWHYILDNSEREQVSNIRMLRGSEFRCRQGFQWPLEPDGREGTARAGLVA